MAVVESSDMICDIYQLATIMQLEAIDVVETHKGDLERHWYSSSGPAELLFLIRRGQLVKHRLDLLDQIIEWNIYDGTRTGYLEVTDIPGVLQSSSTINFDKNPDANLLRMAGQFIGGIDILAGDLRNQIKANYDQPALWGRFSPLTVLKRLFSIKK